MIIPDQASVKNTAQVEHAGGGNLMPSAITTAFPGLPQHVAWRTDLGLQAGNSNMECNHPLQHLNLLRSRNSPSRAPDPTAGFNIQCRQTFSLKTFSLIILRFAKRFKSQE